MWKRFASALFAVASVTLILCPLPVRAGGKGIGEVKVGNWRPSPTFYFPSDGQLRQKGYAFSFVRWDGKGTLTSSASGAPSDTHELRGVFGESSSASDDAASDNRIRLLLLEDLRGQPAIRLAGDTGGKGTHSLSWAYCAPDETGPYSSSSTMDVRVLRTYTVRRIDGMKADNRFPVHLAWGSGDLSLRTQVEGDASASASARFSLIGYLQDTTRSDQPIVPLAPKVMFERSAQFSGKHWSEAALDLPDWTQSDGARFNFWFGGRIELKTSASAVPEPQTWVVVAAGDVALVLPLRRRRSKHR